MKAEKFTIKVEAPKPRRKLAGGSRAHKDKRNAYNRRSFNDPRNWD